MYSESPQKMQTKATPLLLEKPLGTNAHKSQVLHVLRNGPAPDRLNNAEIATLFDEITEMVYGARQAA